MHAFFEKHQNQLGELRMALMSFGKWLILALVTGAVVGVVGVMFLFSINFVTDLRKAHEWLIFLLPLSGLLIVLLYHLSGVKKPQGTDLVLQAVRSPEPIPFRMAPLIFISTVLTHFCGGSAGREGAALQLGGSIGFSLGKVFRLDEKDRHIITMCGMSAAFTALFGTPIASTVFAMEVTSVGVMYYASLVPCAVASITAAYLAQLFGLKSEFPHLFFSGGLEPKKLLLTLLLSMLCGALSIVFCFVLRKSGKLYHHFFKNAYVKIAVGGVLVALLSLVFGKDYLGSGIDVIRSALLGQARPEAFLLKLLFTALTLGAGFKGGEIVPGFFVGATFGCTVGSLLGIDPALGAAVGLLSVFCGVTNCPLSAVLFGVELFGAGGLPYYLLAAAVSYMLSGYSGLYDKQKILYSKYRTEFLGKKQE